MEENVMLAESCPGYGAQPEQQSVVVAGGVVVIGTSDTPEVSIASKKGANKFIDYQEFTKTRFVYPLRKW